MEKEILMSQAVWEGFKGKRIILAGNEWDLREKFQENLAHMAASMADGFEVSEDLRRAGPEQYVILFAHPEDIRRLTELLGQLQEVGKAKPRGAVLLSDNRVYGRLFGKAHPLGTEELGYVCHMMPGDLPAANLRTAEHFACRLAREEGLNIRVARAEAVRSQSGGIFGEMTEAAMRVLLEGEAGAVYNLPMQAQEAAGSRSFLEPIPVTTR